MGDRTAEDLQGDGLDGLDGFGGDGDGEEMRAALGGVASGLAEQLTSITSEMNKIREELYGDNGIGGIAQELEKLKSGSLASNGDLGDLGDLGLGSLGSLESSLGGLLNEAEGLGAGDRSLKEGSRKRSVARPEAKMEKERKLEELRRKIERRQLLEEKAKKKETAGFFEWLVIIFVFFMMVYTASSSFRGQVKQFFGEVLGEESMESESHDFGAIVEEDGDSYF
eukprot:Skav216352  [mRNA]  locus=scaffold2385:215687:216361:- [translate_table: standard]